jgi:hypothetical protein
VGEAALWEGEARGAQGGCKWCRCAEALGGEEVFLGAGYGRGLGGVVPEEAEEGVGARHCGVVAPGAEWVGFGSFEMVESEWL